MKKILQVFSCVFAVSCFLYLAGCNNEPQNRVVLYCSVDDVYARPLVAELEQKTGLKIEVLYDVEAAKTAGLANRIRAEKSRPRGDVFWSSALLQTLLLQREELLQEYSPPGAKDIPAAFKDARGAWTGVGMRERVVMSSAQPPTQNVIGISSESLLTAFYKNKVGISNPQFGTASDWVAAMSVRWGKEKTLDYFRALKKNGVQVLSGNGVVAEKVARGELKAGVTDSDDYRTFSKKFKNETIAHANSFGDGFLIPGSVAILKGAQHSANAQKLVDAIVTAEFEKQFIAKMKGVESLRGMKKTPPADAQKWAEAWLQIRDPLAEILLAP